MGGRKKLLGTVQADVGDGRFFCYYCDREFDDVKSLVHHQRLRHFCCKESGRTFDSITGLRVHMLNAFKKSLKEVPNSMTGRENPNVDVRGMDGLPKGILEERRQRLLANGPDDDDEATKPEATGRQKGAGDKADANSPTDAQSDKEPKLPSPETRSSEPQLPKPVGHGQEDLTGPSSHEVWLAAEADVGDLPVALKCLVEGQADTNGSYDIGQEVPSALACLHSLAVGALASVGLLHGAYLPARVTDLLEAAVVRSLEPEQKLLEQKNLNTPMGPALAGAPLPPLSMGFMPTTLVSGLPATLSQRPPLLGPTAAMGCIPHFPVQGTQTHMAGMLPGMMGPPHAAMQSAAPPGFTSQPRSLGCTGCGACSSQAMGAQPMVGLNTGPMAPAHLHGAMGVPIGGLPTLSSVAAQEPAAKRSKLDVTIAT